MSQGIENEWQPGRLTGQGHQCTSKKIRSTKKPCHKLGALIRVKITEPSGDYKMLCGGRLLAVHPEDVRRMLNLDPEEEYNEFVLCEHGVSTD